MLSLRRINEAGPTRKIEIDNMISELLQGGTRKRVNLNAIFEKVARNFMMRVVNGKTWEKMIIRPPSNLMTICDFFPFLRWVGFNGIEKELRKLKKERDEFLQSLVDECRETRGGISCDEQIGENTNLIEQLLDLQQSEPEYYTDDVLKGIILVRNIVSYHFSFLILLEIYLCKYVLCIPPTDLESNHVYINIISGLFIPKRIK